MRVHSASLLFCLVVAPALLNVGALAQRALPSPTGDGRIRLELIFDGTGKGDGAGERLTIRFINGTENSVSFPHPTLFCGDSRDGFVMVYSRVLNPKDDSRGGTGCVLDKVGRDDILMETANWITIQPLSSYDIVESLHKAVNTDRGTRFEVESRYYPARVKPEELSALEKHGVHLLQDTLGSLPMVIDTANRN